MLERKDIPEETWPLLERMDLAFRLEAHLLRPDSLRLQHMPEFVRDIIEPGTPQAVGWHKFTGWFVLAAGQGPSIDFIEREHIMVPKSLIKQLQEATKARQYDATQAIVHTINQL